MISPELKAQINRGIQPLTQVIARSGIHPNVITLSTPFLVALICWHYAVHQNTVGFVIAVGATAAFDMLDGALARLTNKTSKLGAYLDAMMDRYVDAMIALTVAWVTGYWFLSMLLISGAMMVSYAKARAAIEVSVSNTEWPDLAERAERSAVYMMGLLLNGLLGWQFFGHDIFYWTLIVLNILVHLTVVQRMFRAKQFMEKR